MKKTLMALVAVAALAVSTATPANAWWRGGWGPGIGLGLLGGAIVTETVFALPGVGNLVVSAVLRRDYPVIQGALLVISGVYVLINLGIDILYAVLDPRVRY